MCLYSFCHDQDLHSTNGTYIVDATTGEKTRLAPKKATILPEEGCRVHFGVVACKVSAFVVGGTESNRVQQSRSSVIVLSVDNVSCEAANNTCSRLPLLFKVD